MQIQTWEYYIIIIPARIMMALTAFYVIMNTMTSLWAGIIETKRDFTSKNWKPDVGIVTKLMASIWTGCKAFRRTWIFGV